jgi:glutathionyl-hydroquinone reductase
MGMSYKVILEIRYNQVLEFSDKTFISSLINYLGTLGYQVNFFNDNIDAVNSKIKHHINMGANRCGIDFNTKELDYTSFKEIIENLTGISKLLNFNFLNRIGLRVTTLNSYTTISEANKKITSVLNIENDKLNSIKSSCEVCFLSFAVKKTRS